MKIKSFPNALTFVIAFILFAGVLSYLIPKGSYQRVREVSTQREVVVPGSYQRVEAPQLSPFQILTAIPRGVSDGIEVVVLILFVGGCLYIVDKTGALKEGVTYLASKVSGKEELALIALGVLFVTGGATEGLEEEIVPLIPVLLIMIRNLGYSAMVTVGVSFGSAIIGATFSPVNPFGAVVAQKVAGLPFLSGGIFLLSVLILQFSLWMFMMIRYANKNRITKPDQELLLEAKSTITNSQIIILLLVLFAFVVLIVGMLFWHWSFNEMSAEFLVVGVMVGLIGGLGVDGTFKAYADGFKDMTFAALIVGLAYGIPLVLKEGVVMDTIIYGLFTPLQYVPSQLSAFGMLVSQALLHIVVPSYSGQAVLTIPILAPLSDLIGLSRNVCVMAFQFGAILMNLIAPTNGALMAIIAVAGISYDEWFRFVIKRLAIVFILAALCLGFAIAIGI